jgi:hypothetical protein
MKMIEKIRTIRSFLGMWALSLCGGVLVAVATAHRFQLDSKGYTTSPLIGIEMTLMLIVILLFLAQPAFAVFFCLKKRWRRLAIVGINTILGFAAFVAAMYIDSATLIYMT